MMYDYRRMMEQVTLSDRKKEEIMEMLENKGTHKRRIPHAGKLILAAALAVGCVLSIAAGLPAQVYHFVAGGSVTVVPGTNTAYYNFSETPPAAVEDGRLWLNADGQHLDITDLIDENTPYIYTRTDSETGQKGYLILGGTVDNFGWMEWYQMDGEWYWHAHNCNNLNTAQLAAALEGTVPDDTTATLTDGPVPTGAVMAPPADPAESVFYEYSEDEAFYTIDFRPWVQAAKAQLAQLGVVETTPRFD